MGGGNSFSTWSLLAQKMAQVRLTSLKPQNPSDFSFKANIHCHVVMSPNEDMTSLTLLFEETVSIKTCASDGWHSDFESSGPSPECRRRIPTFSHRPKPSHLPSISPAKSSPVLSERRSVLKFVGLVLSLIVDFITALTRNVRKNVK